MRAAPLVALVALLAAPACATASGEAGGRLRVVTTVAPITSILANVGGDLVQITGLVPEGTNSHTYEPPPRAAAALSDADVVFVNGLHLDDPARRLAAGTMRHGARLVALGDEAITPDEYIFDFSFPKDAGRPNPHLWTDPPLAERYAQLAAGALSSADPDHAAAYQANYRAFAAKIDALDTAMVEATASLPPEHRELLTYHDAYAYFARHYGWRVLGAIQPSDFAEPSAKDVAALIEQVQATGVPAIFGSEVFPSPVLEQIGRETGARYVDTLRDDDLPGEPGDPEHSWLGLMRFDYITMVEALGGDASALRALDVRGAVPDTAEYPQ